jgi:hypothetical protein
VIVFDLVNSCFEIAGGVSTWRNVHTLVKDKKVRGVSLESSLMFTTWGFWNLFYYPSLGQWASFLGGLVIVSGNVAWLALAFWWRDQ